jgi:hypothetical protein
VAELRGSPDEVDGDDRPDFSESASGADDAQTAYQRIEPRTRAAYAEDLRRQVADGQDSLPPSEKAEDAAGKSDAPAGTPGHFDPERAGLQEISAEEAVAYIDAHRAERPWLDVARDCSPDVQRVFAALDQGGGHAHIRHDGWVSEEMNQRRLQCLEDPAQLDEGKRAAHIDGLKSSDQPHRCGSSATRITDPTAFALAITRASEHPDVAGALGQVFKDKWVPPQVVVPINELLGADGHRVCSGWQLESVDGSLKAARKQRDAWAGASADLENIAGPEPKVRPIETFEGGTAAFMFAPNRAKDGYEILTMCVNPPDDPQHGGKPG